MPSENEELDIIRNPRWRHFVNVLRGASLLDADRVLAEFDRAFVPSLRRACGLLKVRELITACINNDQAEVGRLRREHRQQRDRAESFADLIVHVCKPGMKYREGVDAFVHGACARIVDQAQLRAVSSDNFPTHDDYQQESAIWMFRMEPRVAEIVDQVIENPSKLKVARRTKLDRARELDQELGFSLLDQKQGAKDDEPIPDSDQES